MIKRLLLAVALSCAVSLAQVPVSPVTIPHVTFVDAVGSPCAGCKLSSFAAGTTTPLATYVDSTGTGQNTNPITLDAAGGANIWLGGSAYKFALKDPMGSTIWTVDNVQGYVSFCSTTGCTFTGPISGTNATFDSVTAGTINGDTVTAQTITGQTINNVLYPAPGTDLAAFVNASCPSTSCHVHLDSGSYTWGSVVNKSNLIIEGTGQAQYPSSPTDLTGFLAGSGTIIKGNVHIGGQNITLKNLSVDNGSASGSCPLAGGGDSNAINIDNGAGTPLDTLLIENVNTIACSSGVHSILGVANHLTYRNVSTRGGIYGWVAFGTDLTIDGSHDSQHPNNGWIVKSTNFAPAITTSMVNISNTFIDSSGPPNVFGLGGPIFAINIRGLNIQNGAALLINGNTGSGGTQGTVRRLNIDGYQLTANSLSSEGIQIGGDVSEVFLNHLLLDGMTDNGILIDSGVDEVHIANSAITNCTNKGILSGANRLFLDGGISFGTQTAPLNDYPILGNAGRIYIYGSLSGYTNQGSFISPSTTAAVLGMAPTLGGDTQISGFLRSMDANPITVIGNTGATYDFSTRNAAGTVNTFLVNDNGAISWNGGSPIGSSSLVPQVAATPPTSGKAACVKSSGPPAIIGYCSTGVDSGGACTCN